jgi:hypothetical protein
LPSWHWDIPFICWRVTIGRGQFHDGRRRWWCITSILHNNRRILRSSVVYQSSQVCIVIVGCQDESLNPDWSCLFGQWTGMCRCGLVLWTAFDATHFMYRTPLQERSLASPYWQRPRRGRGWSYMTSDGFSIRSPSCMAIPLRTVEVGNRPNDYFVENLTGCTGGTLDCGLGIREAKVLQCQPDTAQDLADRLMRHAIDAFGARWLPTIRTRRMSTHPLPQRLMWVPRLRRGPY